MQKLINVVALLSGLTSAALIGGSAYLLLNKDVLIDSAKEQAIEQVTKSVSEAIPGMIKDQMPELPKTTGGAIPF